jgi:hypothetical protein
MYVGTVCLGILVPHGICYLIVVDWYHVIMDFLRMYRAVDFSIHWSHTSFNIILPPPPPSAHLLVYPVFWVLSFLISETLDKIESNSRLQCCIRDLRGIPPLGVAYTVCTLFTKASRARSVSVALPQLSLFPLHWMAHRYHIKALHSQISWFQNFVMLDELRNVPIEMGDTAYGRFEAGQKRDAEWAYQKMTLAEKESFRRKMAEIDKAEANDGQSPTSNPTPV